MSLIYPEFNMSLNMNLHWIEVDLSNWQFAIVLSIVLHLDQTVSVSMNQVCVLVLK